MAPKPPNHIRRARKPWVCARCEGPIAVGERHFCELGFTLPYGRYITAMVERRLHLSCVRIGDACCQDAENQLRAELEPEPAELAPDDAAQLPLFQGIGPAADR